MADERSLLPGGEDAGGFVTGNPRTPGGRTPGHTLGRTPSSTSDRPAAGSASGGTSGDWLDGDAAERLLSGEPVDGQARPQAHRLAAALRALTDEGRSPATAELPGESAALAAFRQARAERRAEHPVYAEHPEHPEHPVYAPRAEKTRGHVPGRAADRLAGGSVHLGRAGLDRVGRHGGAPAPGWRRPVRFALAALLAGSTIGGVAVAAGSGVLPSLFGGEGGPGSGASVSVATPEHPPGSLTPDVSGGGGSGRPEPGGSWSGSDGGASSQEADGQGEDGSRRPGNGDAGRSGEAAERWKRTVALCRDYRVGKKLDAEKWRYLENSAQANGAGRVDRYCQGVLTKADADGGTNGGSGGSDSDGDGSGSDGDGSGSDGSGKGGSGDKSSDEEDVSAAGISVEKSASGVAGAAGETDAPTATPAVLESSSTPKPPATRPYGALPVG